VLNSQNFPITCKNSFEKENKPKRNQERQQKAKQISRIKSHVKVPKINPMSMCIYTYILEFLFAPIRDYLTGLTDRLPWFIAC